MRRGALVIKRLGPRLGRQDGNIVTNAGYGDTADDCLRVVRDRGGLYPGSVFWIERRGQSAQRDRRLRSLRNLRQFNRQPPRE